MIALETDKSDARLRSTEGLIYGSLGMLAFSLTLPLTRYAAPNLGGFFIGTARALLASVLALVIVRVLREPVPDRRFWKPICLVAMGTIFGFGPLSSLAMQYLPAVHGAVVVGLLPAATAVMAVLRAGERPRRSFWLAALAGVISVLIFAVAQGAGKPQWGDLLLLAAVALAAMGYTEGAIISRELGGWRVISWALVFAIPILVVVVAAQLWWNGMPDGRGTDWMAFLYLGAVSMYLGFFPWYRGLSVGGVAKVGQLQLIQPVLSMIWAAWLLHESISVGSAIAAVLVIGSAVLTRMARD